MSNLKHTIKIVGPAGAGIKSSGLLLSKILLAHNQNLKDYSEYPSLVRGGHNTYQVTFSTDQVFNVHYSVDIIFSLAPKHWQQHSDEFHPDTLILSDEETTSENAKFLHFPLKELGLELGKSIYANTICLGSLAYFLNFNKELSHQIIEKTFGKGSPNTTAFDIGFNYASNNFSQYKKDYNYSLEKNDNHYYDGNEAYGWGFIKGGGNFYAAYPMTPATGTLHFLAAKAKDFNLNIVHPEDEIYASNMILGAAFAGARAATGSSGGGFALMNEALSYAGVAEISSVFYLVSRPGPATGLPTWTGQGDLMHAIYSGHGEFPKVVIAPGDQEESFQFGKDSLNIAAQLQTPVIVVSDKMIGESGSSLKSLELRPKDINQGKLETNPSPEFLRYSLENKDGISSYSIPGTPNGEYLANSYEHSEKGYSIEDSDTTLKMNNKRYLKIQKALEICPKAEVFGTDSAKKLILAWGSPKGAILEALSLLPNASDYCFIQIKTLWPINPDLQKLFTNFSEIIVIENNFTSQLVTLLKSQFDFNPTKLITKADGRPFYPEEIYEQLK